MKKIKYTKEVKYTISIPMMLYYRYCKLCDYLFTDVDVYECPNCGKLTTTCRMAIKEIRRTFQECDDCDERFECLTEGKW